MRLKWCDKHGYMPTSYSYCHYCGALLKKVEPDRLLQKENTELKCENKRLKITIEELKKDVDYLRRINEDDEDEYEELGIDEILL